MSHYRTEKNETSSNCRMVMQLQRGICLFKKKKKARKFLTFVPLAVSVGKQKGTFWRTVLHSFKWKFIMTTGFLK